MDRYDDREVIQTNLIESYDQLMNFAKKYLPDKFFLEDVNRISLRNIIAREMISNTLMHREFTSSYMAKFVIEKNQMYVENANRAIGDGFITLDNLEPNPKNPIIASFFRTIGLADNLGSGTRKLFKYSRIYSGKDPELKEGDVFRISVPLDDAYSFDYYMDKSKNNDNGTDGTDNGTNATIQKQMIEVLKSMPEATTSEISEQLSISVRTIRRTIAELKEQGLIRREGSSRKGKWIVMQ